MKTIFEHIETAKGKPHHIRKRIVFTAAGVGTALVALIWFAGTVSSNAFAIQGSNFADSTGQESVITTSPDSGSQKGLAGAAAALQDSRPPAGGAPAHIEIVDTSPATSTKKQAEQTTIPF